MSLTPALSAAPLVQSSGPSEWAASHGYFPLWIGLMMISAIVLIVVLARQRRKPKVSPAIKHLRGRRAKRRIRTESLDDGTPTTRVFITRVSDPEADQAALHEVDLPRVEHDGRWHTLH